MDKVRIGLIGAGGWGRNHAQGYTAAENAELVAVADNNLETAQKLSKDYHVPNAYGSAKELLADPNVDAVSIVIPNAFHAETAILALDAGKPVLLDKPFALSVTEAEKVIAKARETGLTFMMGMNQRFNRDTQILKEYISDGTLGDIYHAKAYWLRRTGIPRRGSWFGQKELSGGGPLIDIGVHLLDVCLHLIDNSEPVTVSAATYEHLASQLPPLKPEEGSFDVEDFATAFIRMKNGATVQLEASWMLHQPTGNRQDVELYGTKASANLYPVQLHRPSENGYEHIELKAKSELVYPHCSRYQHYVDVLLGDAKQLVSWEQSLAVQKILDAIYESARQECEVTL